jgi:hypothetical protein
LEFLKTTSAERFNSLIEYSKLEVKIWLVSYINKNEYVEDTLHQISIEFIDLESSLYDIKVKQEIGVAPMRDYIENLPY